MRRLGSGQQPSPTEGRYDFQKGILSKATAFTNLACGTSLERWAYGRPYTSSAERTVALASFLTWYNQERPHTALGRQTPQQRLIPAPRRSQPVRQPQLPDGPRCVNPFPID